MFERSYLIGRIKAAIAALDRGPTAEDLACAPHADLWRVMLIAGTTAPVLWAKVTGHPDLGRDDVTTSRLIGLDRSAGWARTVSRWYRLGRPFADLESELAIRMGRPGTPVISFTLPGHLPLDDPLLLDRLMAAYLDRMRHAEP